MILRKTYKSMSRSILLLLTVLVTGTQAQTPLTLAQCIARAEEKNIAVLNAGLDADLTDKNLDRTYWDLAPNLNAGATHGYNYGRVIDRFTNTFATDRVRTNNFYLSSQLDIFRGLSRLNSIKQAGFDSEAAKAGMEAAKNDVRFNVVQAFLDVLGLRERIDAAENQAENTRQQIIRTNALVEGGRVARAELLSLEAQLAQEEYTVTDFRNQHDQRMFALGRALQMDAEEIERFDITGPALDATDVIAPTATVDEVLANVLANNPAFAQSGLQLQSAERSIAIARAGALPTLALSGSVGTGYSGRDVQQVGDPVVGDPVPFGATAGGETVFVPDIRYQTELTPFNKQLDQNLNQSIAFQLNIPLFNNMQNKYAIDRARVQHEKSKNSQLNLRNELQQNVLNALVQQRSAHRQYIAASKSVDASTLALEYAQERFSQGVITSIEMNTAKNNVNRSTADLINAKYQYVMASKYLDILQGMPVSL